MYNIEKGEAMSTNTKQEKMKSKFTEAARSSNRRLITLQFIEEYESVTTLSAKEKGTIKDLKHWIQNK